MFTVIIHCTTQLTLLSPVLPSSSHSCLTLVDILKTIPGAEGRKKEKEQHGQPSHDGRYADHAVQISPATNLGLFKIITIDYTNISQNWFSGFQESGFQAIRFNSKYPSIGTSKRSMNSQNFAHINIFHDFKVFVVLSILFPPAAVFMLKDVGLHLVILFFNTTHLHIIITCSDQSNQEKY